MASGSKQHWSQVLPSSRQLKEHDDRGARDQSGYQHHEDHRKHCRPSDLSENIGSLRPAPIELASHTRETITTSAQTNRKHPARPRGACFKRGKDCSPSALVRQSEGLHERRIGVAAGCTKRLKKPNRSSFSFRNLRSATLFATGGFGFRSGGWRRVVVWRSSILCGSW
jgi:hypothetical protein